MKGAFGTKLVWLPLSVDPIIEAATAARTADAVVAVVGLTSKLEGEEMKVDVPGFQGGDRTNLNLPEEEQSLLGALRGAGKPLVVVLMNGSALAVNWAQEHANAILEAWYSGEEGGTAIAQTLAGVNNPAGRLPVTFYKGVEQLPPFDDYAMKNRTYRYFARRAALSLRLRSVVFQVRIQQSKIVEQRPGGWRSPDSGSGCEKHEPASRR